MKGFAQSALATKRFARRAGSGIFPASLASVAPRFCPVCGVGCLRFRSHGSPRRSDARCPSCGSLERHRAMWSWLKAASPAMGPRLLHFAPEACLENRLRAQVGDGYVSADLARVSDVRLDLTLLPFATGVFDAVLCSHVLEHVPQDQEAMAELRRVMTATAWGILDTPVDLSLPATIEDPEASEEERIRRFGQADHVRLYGRDYPSRLERAGFVVQRIEIAARLGRRTARRLGVPPQEVVWVVTKAERCLDNTTPESPATRSRDVGILQ